MIFFLMVLREVMLSCFLWFLEVTLACGSVPPFLQIAASVSLHKLFTIFFCGFPSFLGPPALGP